MITIKDPISKEQFLVEHNKLSPSNLQATLVLLERFKEEKKPLLKDDAWSIDKLRIPFIAWLLAMPDKKKKEGRKDRGNQTYEDYPNTKIQLS